MRLSDKAHSEANALELRIFEYSLPNQSKHSHILGPDLAKALINQTCPKYVLHKFQIMVGYDYRLHGKIANEKGKRHHMRKISKFYNNIPFNEMIIFKPFDIPILKRGKMSKNNIFRGGFESLHVGYQK